MIGWIILTIIVAIIAAPFLREALRPNRKRLRALAPGDFAQLSRGQTHYQWRGPENGPTVVMVHGLTTPSFVFGPMAEDLAAQGYRVLTYDHYGRGFSDRPRGLQDSAFFTAHLDELLKNQGVTTPFTLLGYSMGGAIAAAYAAQRPERINRLILLAPAGMGHDLGPVARLVINHNWLGRWLMLAFYAKSLRQATEAERGLPSRIKNIVDLQLDETRWRGFTPAVLNSLRGIMDEGLEPAHQKIAEAELPVLAIWGETDEVIPIACKDRLANWNPTATHHVVPGTGHTLAYTDTEAVMGVIAGWYEGM